MLPRLLELHCMIHDYLGLLEELIEKAILRGLVKRVSHKDVLDKGLQIVDNPVRVIGDSLTVHKEVVDFLRTFGTDNICLSFF